MKKKNIFIMFILILTLAFLGGCGTKVDPAEVSEHAMENFLEKISSGNYVVNAEGYLKTTAYSEDLVTFDYEDNSAYTDLAVMSVDNEVFQGPLEEDGTSAILTLKRPTLKHI